MTIDERHHDRRRLRQFLDGRARAEGVERRVLLRLLAAGGALGAAGATLGAARPARTADDPAPGILKPLPEDAFTVHGTNAETRWSALRNTGFHTPNALFFVRNHTATPVLSADDWRLTVWGDGVRAGSVEFGLDELRSLPATEHTAAVECAGNGRGFFASQQGETVSGTAWRLGAIGVARWRGVRLAEVLRRSGLRPEAVDVQPRGLDAPYEDSSGNQLGRVRRPLPLAKALDDVLLAYEMNGEPLPPDHGSPVRVVVPSWVGIASIKWVGDIEVSTVPLYSPWNTDLYRLFGPGHPEGGSAPLTRQTLKSAFELDWDASLTAGVPQKLTGRSWSGAAPIRSVEVSVDGGARWRPARLRDAPRADRWVRWSVPWTPTAPGPATLLARATDATGARQPERTAFNEQGYLFDAVVHHPVRVTAA
ncbi:DMSO/TMAO reductase YedYZ, molybdopterin-dependent catalytic subunit [Streptomyces zhaozhouensis]|uniref:DMSO/TMAO reductase YedYZ, molybdopterin-dependent catalytic subunit n=1 Tax=Streptomyces zhaozhouensis TaxID=1300267 RepID=A0A286DZ80_9ACTN|nr:sulfite oxidase [Streptomyces zhaozhouensis]SOD63930.1 DMSO/TMAO reductase YedYZ, molybdopterin-dependent catalytic subunit [Streptomyces zhaozhouensis]